MRNAGLVWTTIVVLAACEAKPGASPTTETRSVASAAAVAPAKSDAAAALDRLDARTPLPLIPMMAHHQKQNMRDHLAAVQEIVAALAKNDFPTVAKAASRIGFSETMGQMCTHMGAGAPGFTETALRFHRDADKIGEAARLRDGALVLAALGQTLSQCTGCHEAYKQRIVDDAEWSATVGAPAPAHPTHER